ncbi:MAG: septal ring lytic transglycosylase RlpA family protein [Nitrospiraceae bacterium]
MPEARGASCRLLAVTILLTAGFTACQGWTPRQPVHPPGYPLGFVERGTASWYGPGFHGNRTANGEVYDMHKLTAAHRTLPLGSLAFVTSLSNGRQVTVRINDRGPFARGRILDLSFAGAQALGMTGRGTDEVEVKVVGYRRLSSELGVLRLQVASFADLANAQALVDKLRGSYSDVRLVTVDLAGGRRYRVQAGQFQTETQAEASALHLRKWLSVDPLVVRDDT